MIPSERKLTGILSESSLRTGVSTDEKYGFVFSGFSELRSIYMADIKKDIIAEKVKNYKS